MRRQGTRLVALLALAGMTFLSVLPLAHAETEVLAGRHQVVYDIVNPLGVEQITNYKNNGYEIRVLDEPDEFSKRVLVEIDLSPLGSKAPFPVTPGEVPADISGTFLRPEKAIQVGHPQIRTMAEKVVKGATTIAEAYDRIANHLRDYITYDASPSVEQDALSVVRTHRGSCVGYTNLSIALLRSVGIPARYAHGYLPPGYEWGISQEYWGVKTSGGGYHAWLELYYPDAGWTFSDAEYSKNFVDPYHILRYIDDATPIPPQGEATLDINKGATFTLVEETNESHPIDGYDVPEKTILGRRVFEQRNAAIYGHVFDSDGKPVEKGQVVYWSGSRGTVRDFNRAQYAVVALKAGEHRLTIRVDGYAEQEIKVTLQERQLLEKDVRLQKGTTIRGKILNEIPEEARQSGRVLLWQGTAARIFPLAADGSFKIPMIEPGGYKLTVEIKGLENRSEVIDAQPGKDIDLNLTLAPRAWIAGQVLGKAGEPQPGARVYIKNGKFWEGHSADTQGNFTIFGVEEGEHDLKAKHKSLGEVQGKVQVTGTGEARLELKYP